MIICNLSLLSLLYFIITTSSNSRSLLIIPGRSLLIRSQIKDWSLITGRGRGLQNGRGGGQVKFYL